MLRANSNYAGNEYFMPVMGLVFLRHAYSRYLAVKDGIKANLPTRAGKKRALSREDFSQQSAIFLRPKAQFDHLVALPDSADRAAAIIAAMDSIEADYRSLRGVLPRNEYQELDNDVLGQLLRTLNPDELKRVSGDVFGRIYEYFLTQFADQKAHDGGEFFTPVSLVSLIARVLDPDRGTVLDPACGSGGMFVQSARTVEEHGRNATERLTFRGLEKNATTIRLAKMNLAVHGLEGRHPAGHHLLRRPASTGGQGRLRNGQSAVQCGRDRRRQGQERPAPAVRPARRQQERQSFQRQLYLDQLLLQLPERTRARRLRHVLAGFQCRRRRSRSAAAVGRDRPRGRDDRHPRQLLLQPHRALRVMVPQSRQTSRAPRQGVDDRCAQPLPQSHAQDLRLQPRTATEPAGHRLGSTEAKPNATPPSSPTTAR